MMRPLRIAALAAVLAAPAAAQNAAVSQSTIVDGSGKTIGTLVLKGGQNATVGRLTVNAAGLPPGWHGIHFHAVGDCSDVGKFEASKAHVNHQTAKHGLLNAEGPDEGDLPNIFVAADGSVSAEFSTRTLLAGTNGLKDADGSALIVHANEDDHQSQPIGGAGARIACAVIR